MNYLKEETRDALAASYVLGTLTGQARARFKKLMMRHESLTQATWRWEQHLNQWAEELLPVTPPASVWHRIEQRLPQTGLAKPVTSAAQHAPVSSHGAGKWKWLSGLTLAASLALAVLLVNQQTTPAAQPSHIAVINDEQAKPLWVIEVTGEKLSVSSTKNLPLLSRNDYELWIVPEDGSAPESLGILPQTGQWATSLVKNYQPASIKALAVSKEPKGGAPDGSPTEVIYVASLSKLGA